MSKLKTSVSKHAAFKGQFIPFAASVVSIVGCLLFLRLYLVETSRQFLEDFSKQNLEAITSGDTFELATRLNSLSSSVHWVCVSGKIQDRTFYSQAKSAICTETFLQTVRELNAKTNDGITLRFTLTIPTVIKIGGISFAFIQLILLWSLFFAARNAARKNESIRMDGQLQLAKLASQVAHDIRSPLAALSVMQSDLTLLPEGSRNMIRSAIGRINDIANGLLEQNRKIGKSVSVDENAIKDVQKIESLEGHLISTLLDSIVTEKRVQFRSNLGLHIELTTHETAYAIFANINPVEFGRIISNLINNAVEATVDSTVPAKSNSQHVKVSISGKNGICKIQISDNGTGIAPEVLKVLCVRGQTHGKQNGNGLGLAHAKETTERWGGRFQIESAINKGTIVTIELPTVEPPSWFVHRLDIRPDQTVVVVDDEPTIHQIWDSRFLSIENTEMRLNIVHLSTPKEFRDWVQSEMSSPTFKTKDILFLVDYEYQGSPENGIDLINELGIAKNAILVTSRYDDSNIRKQCLESDFRLLPKGLSGHIPIQFKKEVTKVDCVLIDDDPLIHMTWKLIADKNRKKLRCFSSVDEFMQNYENMDRASPVFVDSNLGKGVRGELAAKIIFESGFENIGLVTGYKIPKSDLPNYISSIAGKEPAECLST